MKKRNYHLNGRPVIKKFHFRFKEQPPVFASKEPAFDGFDPPLRYSLDEIGRTEAAAMRVIMMPLVSDSAKMYHKRAGSVIRRLLNNNLRVFRRLIIDGPTYHGHNGTAEYAKYVWWVIERRIGQVQYNADAEAEDWTSAKKDFRKSCLKYWKTFKFAPCGVEQR